MDYIALTIAGSDPGGGAGLQADLKTFHQFGIFGTAVATLITVQNTIRTSRVEMLDASLVGEQIDAVLEDLPPQAVKTGALGTTEIIEAVASRSFPCPLVIDPVMIGKRGALLLDADARSTLRRLLLPRASLVTPNLDEAAELAGLAVVNDLESMRCAARRIADLGAQAVLVKGGHLSSFKSARPGRPAQPGLVAESFDAAGPAARALEFDAIDILWHEGIFMEFRAERLDTRHTHGTGCAYSAAITACLARGLAIPEAVARAKNFVHEAIRTAPGLGAGAGPLNFFIGQPAPSKRKGSL